MSEGYAEWSQDGVRVAYPEGWEVEEASGPAVLFQARSPIEGGEFARVGLQVNDEEGLPFDTFKRGVQLTAGQQLGKVKVTGERDATVPGADRARFLVMDVASEAVLTHLLAAKGSDRRYDLTVVVPRRLEGKVDADAIFRSFSLE